MISQPTEHHTALWQQHLRELFPLKGWAPWWFPTALGVLWHVRGAPRCPVAAAQAAAVLGWLRKDAWGPAPMREATRSIWTKCLAWSAAKHDSDPDEAQRNKPVQAVGNIAQALPNDVTTDLLRKNGCQLHGACWCAAHETEARQWALTRARNRRWLRSGGQEWELAQQALRLKQSHWMQANEILLCRYLIV